MNNTLLTIGIPTFNGAGHIEQVINSLLDELTDNDKCSIEILINDNASQDHVWKIANAYKKLSPELFSIYKNEINVGYDRNVDLIFKRARGTFVWTLADDDIVSLGAIKKILTVLKFHPDVNLLFVGGTPNFHSKSVGNICQDGNMFFKQTAFRSGGISGNIIAKSAWNAVDASRYFDTGWVHFGVVIELASRSTSFIFNEALETEIMGLHKKWAGNGVHLLVGLQLAELFKNMARLGYSAECIKAAHLLIKGNYYRQICKAKAEGLAVDFEMIHRFIKVYYTFPSFWVIDLPILLMPQKLCGLIYQTYRLIKMKATALN
jgi:glycosyltransferase involved in cell wall biosynthesis